MSITDWFRQKLGYSTGIPIRLLDGMPVVANTDGSWAFYNASDPCVVNDGGAWRMYFTAMDPEGRIHVLQATAASLSGKWIVDAQPVLSPAQGTWLNWAIETPCIASEDTMYFTGWSKYNETIGNYSIGVADKIGGRFVARWGQAIVPLLPEEMRSPSILGEPAAFVVGNSMHMLYQCGTVDNRTVLVHAISTDNGWSQRRIVRSPIAPFCYPSVSNIGGKLYITGTTPEEPCSYPRGLYIARLTVDGLGVDIGPPKLLLREDAPLASWLKVSDHPLWPSGKLGFRGSCLASDRGEVFLFLHAFVPTPDRTGTVAQIGRVQVFPAGLP